MTVATVYAPIAYSPTKVLVFKPLEGKLLTVSQTFIHALAIKHKGKHDVCKN